jgi:hypothetical protein
MASINFGSTVSIEQAAKFIARNPTVRVCLLGEPGIGKSSILEMLRRMLQDYLMVYRDAATLDLGDVGCPGIDHDAQLSRMYPNAGFRLTEGAPVCMMIDEFTKASSDAIKNMLHPLLEVNNPRLGDVPLPEGSIVFLTGNLTSDGVGDSLKAHTRNRVTILHVRKPDSAEWLKWAVTSNKISPVIMAWVDRFPHALASYLDSGQEDNPYIFNPKRVQQSFVTPRSLEKASEIVSNPDNADVLIQALAGTVGEAAARDIQAFVAYQEQLPKWEEIMDSPKGAKVPDSAGACAVLVFGAVMRIDANNIDRWMTYLERLDAEWQAAFCCNIARDSAKQGIAFSNKSFAKWVQENEDIL